MSATSSFLSPAQRRILATLEPVVHLAVSGVRNKLPIKPRTHTLLVGPSGSGKSHLASALAGQAKVPVWRESVSNWCPLGARGVPTFPALVHWIQSVDSGVIFIDELDKLTSGGEYFSCIRTEIFSLLDLIVPNTAITVPELTDDDPFEGRLTRGDRQLMAKILAEDKLRNRIFFVAAGAWQDCWTKGKSQQIGFLDEEEPLPCSIDRASLLHSIAPELLQRFRKEVLYLEPMSEADYLQVLTEQMDLIPPRHRNTYEEMIRAAIPSAVRDGLGMRIFEEVYSDLCARILKWVCYDEFVFSDIMQGGPA